MQKFFPRIQEWIWEIMQGRNLILLRLSDKIWPSRVVWSVSVISWYSPHCRPPNNIQLFFLAFLRDTDCCKGHLATCPSLKPSLWLSDLTYFLHSYHYIISIHTKSVEIPTELSHIGPPTHPKYFSNFPNKSGRSSAEDSSFYPSLMIPSRDGEPSAQSKVRVLQGKKMYHTYHDSFAKIMKDGYKGILTIHSHNLLTSSIRFLPSCTLKAFSVIQRARRMGIIINSLKCWLLLPVPFFVRISKFTAHYQK